MDKSDSGEIPNLFLDFFTGALNSLLFRFFSFIIFIKGEGSTKPFFRLLNSPSKNVKVF
jgi:hypothetical protein